MTRIEFSDNGNTAFEKLLGHNPLILDQWNRLEGIFWRDTTLDSLLLEQVRRAMAFENGCEYCMVKGGRPDFDPAQLKMSIASGFAELFCKDHRAIQKAHFDMLKEYFSDREISELCAFIAFIHASQKLGRIFNLTEEYQQHAVTNMNALNKD
ncbi:MULTISPECIES: carboxymuconolactone decarboxylase family protein [Chryseobacterium]|uniref:Alkylhydroperoxidase family enzyme n=1 Tax=Chryseobacterium camelliae TaxID=1265445 RepID=A0ABU0TFX7_9FLAO|nr:MULTISPECIES: carboxymuconolactone decarboxylase family protein [Chryseobacterium]MDT3406275.1 alkylhydroperoxidase family enzyme [Pseudacidovorax intermedius]MDQ1095927.1 alkylhydroperoxidase family enzyme [Chryseobacterium camelliae]MDQ1099863.1 alkylhydroperoxidase family enzyme [Chryseobacterium sp. SORGH_AS_1048]MDR6087209.1 alkylhydroperoxidase family enzyme [Chryseobacterium sp. SORGH_AS_0909]MDR6131583.1 alkylhydroperoxidase family enzyme [Chryseobacterium sp. SORGH_AS_1175]